jgi:hypothetical protein
VRNQKVFNPFCAILLDVIEIIQRDPVLKRFRAAVSEIYGDRLERVVSYGLRAAMHTRSLTMMLQYFCAA